MNLHPFRRVPAALLAVILLAPSSPAAEYYTNWAASRFADIPTQAGPTNDPDGDGDVNLLEFAFGTDPRASGGIGGALNPRTGAAGGTNGVFAVEVLEGRGRQPGAQIDLYLTAQTSPAH